MSGQCNWGNQLYRSSLTNKNKRVFVTAQVTISMVAVEPWSSWALLPSSKMWEMVLHIVSGVVIWDGMTHIWLRPTTLNAFFELVLARLAPKWARASSPSEWSQTWVQVDLVIYVCLKHLLEKLIGSNLTITFEFNSIHWHPLPNVHRRLTESNLPNLGFALVASSGIWGGVEGG